MMSETILVVDDERQMSEMMRKGFERAGYTAVNAMSAEQALDIVGRVSVDAVILDLAMPGMDGLSLSRKLMDQDPDRPVLLMTAHGTLDSAQRAIDIGIYGYFRKPFHFNEVLAKVRQALEHRRLVLENRKYQEDLERRVEERVAELKTLNEQLQREIVQRTQAEAALREAHDELEKRVEARTADLATANKQLQEEMTERKRMEGELIRSQRLRAVGELSAGVSHNLNNILTGVLGPAQMIQIMTDDPTILRETELIVSSTLRARDLIHHLHLFTRGMDADEIQRVEVKKIAKEAVNTARPRWKDESEAKGIRIEVVMDLGDVPPVEGTELGLHDIFVNLLFNAVDAMPEGGTITIRTESIDEGIQITVSDTGIGMEEETRRRVFEPFFTTKMDVGSGLGLSTGHGAVNRWGGRIDVESAVAEGTTFTIRLPVWKGGNEAEDVEPIQAHQTRRGKLLIAEDDEVVCELLSRFLSQNHEVEVVQDGKEALEAFAPGRYDVALIDLGIPEVPGDRVARQIEALDPSLATVLITGWELPGDDARLSLFDFKIQKPFEDLRKVQFLVAEAMALHDERARRV